MKASARVGADVVRKEGLAALMKGSVVFSGKRVADWTSRYFFAVSFERLLFKKDDEEYKLSTVNLLVCVCVWLCDCVCFFLGVGGGGRGRGKEEGGRCCVVFCVVLCCVVVVVLLCM